MQRVLSCTSLEAVRDSCISGCLVSPVWDFRDSESLWRHLSFRVIHHATLHKNQIKIVLVSSLVLAIAIRTVLSSDAPRTLAALSFSFM